jgi:hypothetical protein
MSPSNENPPLTGLDVSGQATVEIKVTRAGGQIVSAMADFHVNWRSSQPEELRAMHIHRGAAGVNGPVVVNTNLGTQAASTGSTIFRQAIVTDFKLVEEIMANPGGFYLNAHSASNPGGIIRGQLMMDTASRLKIVEANLQKTMDDLDALIRSGFNFPRRR